VCHAGPTQSEFFADPLLVKPSVEGPAIRPADPKNEQLPNRRLSLGKLAQLGRLDPLAFARYLIMLFIGVTATLAWQSYAAREIIAPAAPSPDQQQINAMSLDLDAVRQSIDRIATSQEQMRRSVDKLGAVQEWMTRDFNNKLEAVEHDIFDKISVPPPRPAPAPARKPVPLSSQAPTVR
jgi:hypothetical protein